MGNLLVWQFAKPASLRHFFYIGTHLRPIRKFRPTPFPLTARSERCNQTECPPFPIWEIEISRPMLLEEIFVFQADQLGKPASYDARKKSNENPMYPVHSRSPERQSRLDLVFHPARCCGTIHCRLSGQSVHRCEYRECESRQ